MDLKDQVRTVEEWSHLAGNADTLGLAFYQFEYLVTDAVIVVVATIVRSTQVVIDKDLSLVAKQ